MEWTQLPAGERPRFSPSSPVIGVAIRLDYWGHPYFYYGPRGGVDGFHAYPTTGEVYATLGGQLMDEVRVSNIMHACLFFGHEYNRMGRTMNPTTFKPLVFFMRQDFAFGQSDGKPFLVVLCPGDERIETYRHDQSLPFSMTEIPPEHEGDAHAWYEEQHS